MNKIEPLLLQDRIYEHTIEVADNLDPDQPVFIQIENGVALGLTVEQVEDMIGKMLEILNKR